MPGKGSVMARRKLSAIVRYLQHHIAAALRAALLYAGGQAAGTVSIQVTALAEGVLRTMFVTKLKMAVLMILAAGLLSAGGALTHVFSAAPQPQAKEETPPSRQEAAPKKEAKPIAVHVVKPKPGGLARKVEQMGSVAAAEQQVVGALVSGTIKEVRVDIGDRVKRGQLLAELDAPLVMKEVESAQAELEMAEAHVLEAEAQVETAKAEMESAKADLSKVRADGDGMQAKLKSALTRLNLLEQQFKNATIAQEQVQIGRDQVESVRAQIHGTEAQYNAAKAVVNVKVGKINHAQAAVRAAQANVKASKIALEKAKIQLERTSLRAVFDGVVTRRTAQPGQFVQPSDARLLLPLLTLQRADRLRVVVQVFSRDAVFIERGDPVDLTLDDLPGVRISSQVARFSPVLDPNATMTVEIDVSNPDKRLMPGMSGRVTIRPQKRLTEAFVVPSSCLRSGPAVYIVREGKARRTIVEVTTNDGKNMEILRGIQASDAIVTDPKNLEGEVVPVEIKKTP